MRFKFMFTTWKVILLEIYVPTLPTVKETANVIVT